MSKKKKKLTSSQKKTLKNMKKVRRQDSCNLREVIEGKLKWAKEEQEKGIKTIENIKTQMLKLEGIILFCNDILNPSEESSKN